MNFNIHPNLDKIFFFGQVEVLGFFASNLKVLFMVEKMEDVLLGNFIALGLSIKSYLVDNTW